MKVNQNRKFTNEEAAQIRDEYASGEYSQRVLTEKWGASLPVIVKILHGETYKDAGGTITPRRYTGGNLQSRVERNEHNIAKLMEKAYGIRLSESSGQPEKGDSSC